VYADPAVKAGQYAAHVLQTAYCLLAAAGLPAGKQRETKPAHLPQACHAPNPCQLCPSTGEAGRNAAVAASAVAAAAATEMTARTALALETKAITGSKCKAAEA